MKLLSLPVQHFNFCHRNVEGLDLELPTYDHTSVAPFSESKLLSTISPKVYTAIVDGECVNTQQNVSASSDASDDVQIIGSHCKWSSNKPKSQIKKIRRTMPNDKELDRISQRDKLTYHFINYACNSLKQ